jgi:hypothetical protein
MAQEALVGEDGPDIAIELDGPLLRSRGGS